MTTDTDKRLAEIKGRAEKASEGDWFDAGSDVFGDHAICSAYSELAIAAVVTNLRPPQEVQANADFIAHAHQDIPFLLDEIDRLVRGEHYTLVSSQSNAADASAKIECLEKALSAAKGYMTNALIDLETGAKKQTTIGTLRGGIKIIDDVLQSKQEKMG